MSKVLCYSVRLSSLISISDKAWLATAFDGSEAILPKSQIFGQDYSVMKSEAYWIAAWILEKKDLQYSGKKKAWINRETGQVEPHYEVTKHVPEDLTPSEQGPDKNLKR